jgi:phosphatidylethanolamine-binding protein (PEBP) family uncharacterized protein
MFIRTARVLAVVVALTTVTACSRDGRTLAPALPEQNQSIAIVASESTTALQPSEGFALRGPWIEGADIDLAFTCYGRQVSPPLEIFEQPVGTVTLAVLLHDLETPDRLLWTMANIAGGTVAIGEGSTPPDVIVATNSDGGIGYQPPCPPSGERRQYLMTLFALDSVIDPAGVTNPDGSVDADALLGAVEMATFDLAESTFYVQAP